MGGKKRRQSRGIFRNPEAESLASSASAASAEWRMACGARVGTAESKKKKKKNQRREEDNNNDNKKMGGNEKKKENKKKENDEGA